MLSSWILFAVVPPLLLIEGFFSGSEIALLAADKLTLKKNARHGSKGAKLALELATHPERVLSTTLVMTSFCVVGITAVISLFCLERYRYANLIAVAITSPMVLFLGELLPKTLYQRRATAIAPWIAYPIYWTYMIFYPITRLLSSYTAKLARFMGPIEEMLAGKRRTTRDELRSLLSYSRKESEIKPVEKSMIKRIFDFKDSEAKHALIPLVRVEGIEETGTVKEALERFEEHRHSRMPVFSERIDNIVGVIETNDLMTATDVQQPIRNYMSSAHYVAETQSLEDLLLEMHEEDTEMAVVVDEHGGAVGILTFEDIVEEIVGEIRDEDDIETVHYRELGPRSWLIQARMEIQQINEILKLEMPEGDYETLSGFLLQQFGRIPEQADELYFSTPAGPLRFTIRRATERHIETVLVELMEVLKQKQT